MSDYDSDEDTQPKKRKIKETRIPNGLENGPVKHKKSKYHIHQQNYFHYIPYAHLLVCVALIKLMQW